MRSRLERKVPARAEVTDCLAASSIPTRCFDAPALMDDWNRSTEALVPIEVCLPAALHAERLVATIWPLDGVRMMKPRLSEAPATVCATSVSVRVPSGATLKVISASGCCHLDTPLVRTVLRRDGISGP